MYIIIYIYISICVCKYRLPYIYCLVTFAHVIYPLLGNVWKNILELDMWIWHFALLSYLMWKLVCSIRKTNIKPTRDREIWRDCVRHFEFFRLLHGNGLIWMEIEETLMETYQAMCNQSYACWWPSTVGARTSAGRAITTLGSRIYTGSDL